MTWLSLQGCLKWTLFCGIYWLCRASIVDLLVVPNNACLISLPGYNDMVPRVTKEPYHILRDRFGFAGHRRFSAR
jgi:hypothetical protein